MGVAVMRQMLNFFARIRTWLRGCIVGFPIPWRVHSFAFGVRLARPLYISFQHERACLAVEWTFRPGFSI